MSERGRSRRSDVECRYGSAHWRSSVYTVVQGCTGDGIASTVEELGRHHKGSLAQHQEVIHGYLVADEVVGKLYPGDKLIVLIVCRSGIGTRLNGHTGRTRHRISHSAVDLNSNRKSRTRASIALVHYINFVGSFFKNHRPVGPAGAADLAVGREHHPLLAVWGGSEGLGDDEVVGSDRSQTPDAH